MAEWVRCSSRAKYSPSERKSSLQAEVFVPRTRGVRHAIVERRDGAAFARDLGRDALVHLAGGPVVHEEQELGLAEHVDEPWSDDEAGRRR